MDNLGCRSRGVRDSAAPGSLARADREGLIGADGPRMRSLERGGGRPGRPGNPGPARPRTRHVRPYLAPSVAGRGAQEAAPTVGVPAGLGLPPRTSPAAAAPPKSLLIGSLNVCFRVRSRPVAAATEPRAVLAPKLAPGRRAGDPGGIAESREPELHISVK